MNAVLDPAGTVKQAHDAPTALLRTLVVCDLVDSTRIVGLLGDQAAAELFRRHDRMARALLTAHGGREIDKTDGFLLMFDRPVKAVAFALGYLRELQASGEDPSTPLAARVGIHVGDVVAWDNSLEDVARGAKPIEVEGLVKAITARLMQLALPNQILLSGVAHALAQRAQGELGLQLQTVRWRTHGRYRFKGIPDPIAVFEVGDEGLAPLKAPPWSGKAHREVPFWRRPVTLGIELATLLILLAIPAWYLLRPAPAIAFASRDWVVVADLKNLTGDSRFDESVETAFRIGLEQSRFVNVLSDLKARDTVQRMRLDPGKTAIDRAVGSEVALREGARALILPTVAEIGGRVRVTAEVIDPKTQTTVWSESADGAGANSVLPSLDKVNRSLRVRLGEALATVSNDSKPLEQVTTRNLDALRAYTLGSAAYGAGRMKEALPLLKRAVELDPDFALAHILIGKIHNNANEYGEYKTALDRADALRDHLSPRDALYVEAERAVGRSEKAGLEKVKLLASLYPDFYPAWGRLAFLSWQLNQYETAIASAKNSASERNPSRALGEYLLGILHLAKGQNAEAQRAFSTAAAAGFNRTEYPASLFASQREFDRAESTLRSGTPSGRLADDIDAHVPRIAFAIDRGHWREARDALDAAKRDAVTLPSSVQRWFEGMQQGLSALAGTSDKGALVSYSKAEAAALRKAGNATDRQQARFHLVFAAYLAARQGDAVLANSLMAESGARDRALDDKVLAHFAAIADLEIARASDHVGDALATLQAQIDGSELCLAHAALMEAYASRGDDAAALSEARWLATHRGRAYAEYGAHQFLTVFNVAQSNLALLRSAELLLAMGKKEDARKEFGEFGKAWPTAELPPVLAARVATLAAALR